MAKLLCIKNDDETLGSGRVEQGEGMKVGRRGRPCVRRLKTRQKGNQAEFHKGRVTKNVLNHKNA